MGGLAFLLDYMTILTFCKKTICTKMIVLNKKNLNKLDKCVIIDITNDMLNNEYNSPTDSISEA